MLFGLVACKENETPPVLNEKPPYTVTFNTAGGSAVDPKNVEVVLYAPTSIKENHILEGWYFDSNKTIPAEFPLSVDSDFTLYAKWKESLRSMQNRFSAYIEAEGNAIEKRTTSGNFSYEYKVEAIGKFIYYTWKRIYTDSTDSTYKTTYSFNIRFDFGDFTTAEGSVIFNHQQSSGICTSTYVFYSAKKEGSVYLLNLHETNFYNSTSYNYEPKKIEQDIQATLFSALTDIQTATVAAGIGLFNYILDYNYVY